MPDISVFPYFFPYFFPLAVKKASDALTSEAHFYASIT